MHIHMDLTLLINLLHILFSTLKYWPRRATSTQEYNCKRDDKGLDSHLGELYV